MATSKIQVAPERIAEGKQLYELTLTPVPDIAALMGISRRTLARRIPEWGWTPRSAPHFAADRAHVATAPAAAAPVAAVANAGAGGAASNPVSPEARIALAARLQITVQRTLAAVARTLQEMAAFTKPNEVAPPDETDDDSIPRDIDELREALARRIRGFIEARRNGAGGLLDGRKSELD
jgi:hypothetical protein